MAELNTKYIDNLQSQINNAYDCQTLQSIIDNSINPYFDGLLAGIRADIAKLLPLISIPTDLGSVISWITNYITLISGPYYKLIALEAEVISAYASLIAAISARISIKGCSFSPPTPLV